MLISRGQILPINNPTNGQDGNAFWMDGPVFTVVSWLSNLTEEEIADWQSGSYIYGVFVEDSVPFFLAGFEQSNIIVEASINVMAEIERGGFSCDFLAGEANVLHMVLVDAQTNIVHSLRMLGMGATAANTLRTACAEQVEQYASGQDVAAKIMALMQKYTTEDMLQNIQTYRPA